MGEQLAQSWGEALLLGAVEGATEFLPISSTGHLIVLGAWLGRTSISDKTFAIAIQLGAILAVCWVYRQRLMGLVRGLVQGEPQAWRLGGALLTAFMPAAAVGAVWGGVIQERLMTPTVVAIALAAGGVVLLAVERWRPRVRTVEVERITLGQAVVIGCAQCLALIPGTSRAAATIVGGVLIGLSRETAAEFSFLLAIPTMAAASLYAVWRGWEDLSGGALGEIALGFAAAFAAGLAAVRLLLAVVSRFSLAPFGWYRLGLAGVVWIVERGR
ncbi:MAG: undecaprenyl-diphosphate phosphatase [Hydrogenophilus sp.]|nr:undecaprenyl-diphosphate phosphatase [Hydrogenophilus sp.]